jgi:hypothetical protein
MVGWSLIDPLSDMPLDEPSATVTIDRYREAVQPEETQMPTSVKQLMEAANAVVPKITPGEARGMMAKGNTLVVDVRDAPELEKSGKIAGAVHHSRGIVYCASGGRSALAGSVQRH